MATIRTAVVDDHPIARCGIKDMLTQIDGIDVCVEAASGVEAVEKLLECRPDLVLLDMVLPELDGMHVLKEIRRRLPQTKVIIISALESDATVREAFANEADGYIPKQASQEELAEAVATVLAGDLYVHPAIALPKRGSDGYSRSLTARQREVLRLMAKGASNKEIAEELGVTPETVKSHVAEILRRLDCKDRTSAVARAMQEHLL